MITAEGTLAALAPVIARMRHAAQEEAARIRADAGREATAIRTQASRQARDTLSEARAEGRAEADPLVAAELSRSRSEARAMQLRAEREVYDELRRQVRAAVSVLPGSPGYDRLAGRLTLMARLAAGPAATVTSLPSGGVVARSPGVIVDCSLDRLADLAVEALGTDVRGLWTP